MFSLDDFYIIIEKNLFDHFLIRRHYFYPHGSIDPTHFMPSPHPSWAKVYYPTKENLICTYDQEPVYVETYENLLLNNSGIRYYLSTNNIMKLFAHSEHSQTVKTICKEYNMIGWYYFFHGFASLNWYKVFYHLPKIENNASKLFITFNNLVTKDRSYRLNLIARLANNDILQHGMVSCQLEDTYGTWKDEILSSNSKLSIESKKLIYSHFSTLDSPYIVDQDPHGKLSAELDVSLIQQALWFVVTETVFYHEKLHLTEKIFKPIVARRPFLLVAAPGNLKYLKSYGFKTFNKWVDESYDDEPDNDKRIQMIVNELTRMSKMTNSELKTMHEEMQEILDFNFNHFYTDFKIKIVNELVDNFEVCVKQYNLGRIGDKRISYIDNFDFEAVKRRMLLC